MNIFLILIILILSLTRILRWLAIVQQKEYRFDRLLLFSRSAEGQAEFLYFPTFSDFRRTALKRPVLTGRILMLAAGSVLFFTAVFWLVLASEYDILTKFFSMIVLYFLLPIFVLLSAAATAIPLRVFSGLLLMQATRRIKSVAPLIIGVTGSYGKSSTKQLLAHVLKKKFSVYSTPRSFNTRLSIARSIMKNYKDQQIVIIEYAAYRAGEIAELANLFPPNMAVITGITSQHLGLFGSMENLLKAKFELVESLAEDGLVFYNGKDETLRKEFAKRKVEATDYWLKYSDALANVKMDSLGRLSFKWKGELVKTNVVGKHYLENILAAIAVARHLGIRRGEIVKALESFEPSSNFVSCRENSKNALIVDDSGTCNPKGFEAALKLVAELKRKCKMMIFAGIVDLGKDSDDIHRKLSKLSKKEMQYVLYTGVHGAGQFKKEFKSNFIDSEKKIIEKIKSADRNNLILVEGRIPKHIYQLLK